MSQHEEFNLDRHVSVGHMIDPTGKKWEIKAQRGTSLVRARPNPDHLNAVIPREFEGQWTSAATLKERINDWLNMQWNKAEEAQRLSALKQGRSVIKELIEPSPEKITPEESLAALDPEIIADLNIDLRTEMERTADEEAELARVALAEKPVVKKKAKKKVTKKG